MNLSCISASISFVRRKVTDEILGFAYAITVTFFVTLEVYPRESVTVSVTDTLPDFSILPTVIAAPELLDADNPLQDAV